MNEDFPKFLTFDLVLELHREMIDAYGGSHGICESGLIESAIAQGQNAYSYGGCDLFGIATAYAFHLGRVKVNQRIEDERDVNESSEHGVKFFKA